MTKFEDFLESQTSSGEEIRIGDLDKSPFKLVRNLLVKITGVKDSAEARKSINEALDICYYEKNLFDKDVKNKILVFGDTLKNDEEDLVDYDYLNIIISRYSEFDIKNLYNLSFDEFGAKTPYEQNLLIKNAITLMEIKAKREAEMLREVKETEDDVKRRANGIGDLDEEFTD